MLTPSALLDAWTLPSFDVLGWQRLNGSGRHAAHQGIRWDIFMHHRAGRHNTAAPDGHAGQDHGSCADPAAILDHNRRKAAFTHRCACHVASWVDVTRTT